MYIFIGIYQKKSKNKIKIATRDENEREYYE
jgi:hypothetical protein